MAITEMYKKTPAYRFISARSAKTLLTYSWILLGVAAMDLVRGIVLILTWRGGPDLFYGIISLVVLVYLPWIALALRRIAKEKQAGESAADPAA